MNNTDTIRAKEQHEPTAIVLMIPPTAQEPQELPFPVQRPEHSKDVFLALLNAEGTSVLAIDATLISAIREVARVLDIEIRPLVGLEGEYAPYWMTQVATLPHAILSEIMLTLQESASLGGDGIQRSKRPTDTMKPMDDKGVERRAQATWEPKHGLDDSE